MKNSKIKSIKVSLVNYLAYLAWIAITIIMQMPPVIVLLPFIIETGIRMLIFFIGFPFYLRMIKHIDEFSVWEILDKSEYTKEGIQEMELLYLNLKSIEEKVTPAELIKLYNDIDEHFDEVFDILQYTTRNLSKGR